MDLTVKPLVSQSNPSLYVDLIKNGFRNLPSFILAGGIFPKEKLHLPK
jgi:hypothetical protein